jgi:hypothetical protein
MSVSELLLIEFDEEMKKTRTALERVPADKGDFAPHPKSTPLRKLAPHIAQLGGFGLSILTTPELDFATGSYKPLPFESVAQLTNVSTRVQQRSGQRYKIRRMTHGRTIGS